MVTRRLSQGDNVILQRIIHIDIPYLFLKREQLMTVNDHANFCNGMLPPEIGQDLTLIASRGISHRKPHQKTIQLRLRERKGASYSMGFCVASTRNGRGRSRVTPSAVTCCSCIASSRAAWVRGVARLISSAKRMLTKIGQGLNSNSPLF